MLSGNTPTEIHCTNVGTAQPNQTDKTKYHSHFMRYAVMGGWVLLLSPFTGTETGALERLSSLGSEKKKWDQLSVGWTTDPKKSKHRAP